MVRTNVVGVGLSIIMCVLLFPVTASAQAPTSSGIAGVVRDSSGGVLPGVTVEASSPALIEKVRTAVTDGTGQYRVENLRPGVYSVKFSLSGFSTVKREGLELSGSMTASVAVELPVGSLEETFTTSGSLGEVESGGPVMNIVPKSGGNRLSASAFGSWANGNLQSGNLNDELRKLNVTPSPLIKSYDLSGSIGAPIRRDRLWFFGTARAQGNAAYITNMY